MSGHCKKRQRLSADLISTSQAAEILFVSRQHVEKLIEAGQLPLRHATGQQRFLRADDVLAVKAEQSAKAREGLLEMMDASERAGLYEKEAREAMAASIPKSFPRQPSGTSAGGRPLEAELGADDGVVHAGWTVEELWQRYIACLNLARLVANECSRMAEARATLSCESDLKGTLDRLARKFAQRGTLSCAERDWIVERARWILGG